jgi:microcystin-dependent protein
MAEPFLAEIRIAGFNFAPRGYALCNGQLLAISQNTALFALIGTFYGGNGTSNFALPNLQGRAPIHSGQLAGGSPYVIGEISGVADVTLIQAEMPSHGHTAQCTQGTAVANQLSPAANTWAGAVQRPYAATSTGQLSAQALGLTGGSQPHNNLPPYLVLTFIIALQGVFPARN